MTENEGTPPTTVEAPAAQGTPAVDSEVTTLRSRNAGLDAKVTELQRIAAANEARATAAEARALELATAGTNGDAELRAQLEAQKQLIAATQREAQLARIESKFPETFATLGEAAASLTADQLAAAEARFAGVASGSGEVPETSHPVGNNPQRTVGNAPKALADMTTKELDAAIRGMDPALMYASRS
jgi:hypothetical protein